MKNIIQALIVCMLVGTTSGCARVIDDGEAGVKFDLGKISEKTLLPGMNFFIPIISRIEVWNVKTVEIKEVANVPSSEGLITTLDVSVLFKIPTESVIKVRRNIGQEVVNIVIIPNIRDAIRNIVSGYPVKALFSDKGRTEISQKIYERLHEKLNPHGVLIQDVLLRDVKLPMTFAQSIESKLKAEQESLQKEFELEKARKDAEIEITKSKGVAESNRIIAESINEKYLKYRWIEGLKSSELQVIYVPTEANLPLLEAQRLQVSTD